VNILTDKENEKITPPLKLMTRNEVINDLNSYLFKNMPIRKMPTLP
jgi:hypothetical protein